MFDNRDKQLSDLETAYAAFIETMQGLSTESFLKPLGDWTARDIAAHFIGWNRITLIGCSELREGVEPFYFHDGTNDYFKVKSFGIDQFKMSIYNRWGEPVYTSHDKSKHWNGKINNSNRIICRICTQRSTK